MHSYPLIHAIPFSIYVWLPFFAVVWWAFCPLGVVLFRCLFSGGVLGPVSFGLLFVSACSVCPCVSGVVWSVCVPCDVLWCCGFVLAFGCCCFFLPRLLCAFLLLLCGVASVWPVLSWLRPPLVLPSPSVGPLVPSGPVSVLLVPPSGYLVVFATAQLSCLWYGSVVTAWLLSSLLHMATKASALCGVLPSTPCCGCCSGATSFLHWGIRPWVIQNPLQDTVRAACALLLGLCCFLPSVLAAFPGALSLLLLLASACFLPPRPCSHLGFHRPHLSLCVVLCVVCYPFLAFFLWFFGLFFVWCFWSALPVVLLFLCAVPGVSLLRWLRIAEGRRPQHHTHTPATVTSSLPSRICWRLVCPWIRLFFCLSWLSCCLAPLARLSCSVRGVGFSRPEPWTRLHCSELHWHDPVALSVGQPGAPVSSKACAHGSGVSFSESMVSSWPTRWVSGVCSGFFSWTPWLRRCNALQVLYWDEDTREAPEQFCRLFSNLAPGDCARLRICFPVAAAGRSWHNVLLTLHVVTGLFSPSTWYGIHVYPVMNLVFLLPEGWKPYFQFLKTLVSFKQELALANNWTCKAWKLHPFQT